ncbi:MAG: D-cysteine desulfhydrase family protein [Bacteroides sp.]|jgi:D-cysteine desulfhydrase|nr:D-cysteine desulfhydrase family protein [Bacteroides sp.]
MKKFPLGFFPTPLHGLERLSDKYRPYELFIKRDDQTGLASGGNKTRKLEYLLAEALAQGCNTLVTLGAQQSNHCRQTAAAAARAGLDCHLIVRGKAPAMPNGNLLLSLLLGAEIHYAGAEITDAYIAQVINELRSFGLKPYLIPYGGSNTTGVMGYADAVAELKQQMEEKSLSFDYIFFASCSGGTQAGLMLGKEKFGLDARLMPVSIQKPEAGFSSLEEMALKLVYDTRESMGIEHNFNASDARLIKGYDEAGYGVVTQSEHKAIHELARLEGILLDPVYTARAFNAMTDYLGKGKVPSGSKILFWHTGGLPANFHYAAEIL